MNPVDLLLMVIRLYSLILFARAIISWIPNLDPYNPAVRILYQLTEPVLQPIRKLIPPIGGTMDVSIIVAFLALWFIGEVLQTMI